MQKIKNILKLRHPVTALVTVLLLLSGGVLTFALVVRSVPTYGEANTLNYEGYMVSMFTDWSKKVSDSGDQRVVTLTDYINKKDINSSIFARQIVTVQPWAVPENQLVPSQRSTIADQISNESFLVGSLQQGIDECKSPNNVLINDTNPLAVKNAFIVIDFSFSCNAKDVPIQVVGKLLVSNDGSIAQSVFVASDKVFSQNNTSFQEALRLFHKL